MKWNYLLLLLCNKITQCLHPPRQGSHKRQPTQSRCLCCWLHFAASGGTRKRRTRKQSLGYCRPASVPLGRLRVTLRDPTFDKRSHNNDKGEALRFTDEPVDPRRPCWFFAARPFSESITTALLLDYGRRSISICFYVDVHALLLGTFCFTVA